MNTVMSIPALRILFAAAFLSLTWGAVFLLRLRISNTRFGKSRERIKALATFLIFACSYFMLEVMMNINGRKELSTVSSVALFFGSFPLWICTMLLLILVVVFIYLMEDYRQWSNDHISNLSIKESIDLLSAGVAVYTEKGLPVVINPVMDNIGVAAFGENMYGSTGLYEKLLGYDKDVIRAGDEYYTFRKNRFNIDGVECVEFICDNVSDEYKTAGLLKEENERLKRMNEHLKELNSTIDSYVIENEILNAKVMVHDRLGQTLLATQKYLLDSDSADEERSGELLDMWKENIGFMSNSMDDQKTDELMALLTAAEDVGVGLVFNGKALTGDDFYDCFGTDTYPAHIALTAIHECMTNTLRHAKGDEVYITAERKDGSCSMVITNNGSSRESQVVEKGGLKSLRSLVENSGGRMEILTDEGFMLRINIRTGRE